MVRIGNIESSSSSMVQQPCVGPGRLQKLLPDKVAYLVIASSDFVTRVGGIE
jgi:hypothetical protein